MKSSISLLIACLFVASSSADQDVDSLSQNSVSEREDRKIGILGYTLETGDPNPSIKAERQTVPTNLGGIASLLFVMTAPLIAPMIARASAKASERIETNAEPYLQWRREDTMDRLFGPFQNGMSLIGKRMRKGTQRLGVAMKNTRDHLPEMIRDTARSARIRNFNNIKRMGAATNNMVGALANNVQKTRVRNYNNIARMGSALGSFAARAARRIG